MLFAAIIFLACATRAGAAIVALKDGSSLRGKVIGQTADGLELVTPDGTLHVGLDRILRVDYAEPPPLPLDLPLGAAGTASPAPAPSAATSRPHLISLGFGLIKPVSRVDFHSIGGGSADNGDLGAQFAAQYLYFLTPCLGAGFDVDYFGRGGTISERLFPAASASVRGDSWLMLGVLRLMLRHSGAARPFLLIGAGGAYSSETVDVRPSGNWADTATHETRRLIDDSSWTPAASARIGVEINVDAIEPAIITLEAGWTGLAAARYGATPQGQKLGLSGISGPLSVIAFTARYGWRF